MYLLSSLPRWPNSSTHVITELGMYLQHMSAPGMCFYEHALLITLVKVLSGNVNVSFFQCSIFCPWRDNRKLIACCSLTGVAMLMWTRSHAGPFCSPVEHERLWWCWFCYWLFSECSKHCFVFFGVGRLLIITFPPPRKVLCWKVFVRRRSVETGYDDTDLGRAATVEIATVLNWPKHVQLTMIAINRGSPELSRPVLRYVIIVISGCNYYYTAMRPVS